MMNRQSKEFSEKLYDILEDSKNSDIVRWSDSGLSFVVLDTVEFAREILESYFKHRNLNSFVRQLNKYDFHKVKSSAETVQKYGLQVWEFQHVHFQRRRRDLLSRIRRKRSGSERRDEHGSFESDIAEKSILLQNQMLNSLRTLSKHFQMVSEDIIELKRIIIGEKSASELGGNKALVYEEGLNFRMMSVSLLQKAGFVVYVADTNNEFVVQIKRRRFDFILISTTLLNDFLLISEIRRTDVNVIIVLTGAYFSRNDHLEYHKLGIDEFLSKPYTEDMLAAVLKKHEFTKKHAGADKSLIDANDLKYM